MHRRERLEPVFAGVECSVSKVFSDTGKSNKEAIEPVHMRDVDRGGGIWMRSRPLIPSHGQCGCLLFYTCQEFIILVRAATKMASNVACSSSHIMKRGIFEGRDVSRLRPQVTFRRSSTHGRSSKPSKPRSKTMSKFVGDCGEGRGSSV